MLIDEYVPRYDVIKHHEKFIDAPPATVYACAREIDLSKTRWSRMLLVVRGIPHFLTGKARPSTKLGLEEIGGLGFVTLDEDPGTEIVIGVIGRFWRLTSGIERVSAADFVSFGEPGYAKCAMNLHVEPEGNGSRFVTETRVICTSDDARRKFLAYWRLIGPFSGFIRIEMLRAIEAAAERSTAA